MPEISREKCYSAKKFGGGNMLFEGRVANSASCERVFALLKRMFGEQQLAALADQIRAGVKVAYNDRTVG